MSESVGTFPLHTRLTEREGGRVVLVYFQMRACYVEIMVATTLCVSREDDRHSTIFFGNMLNLGSVFTPKFLRAVIALGGILTNPKPTLQLEISYKFCQSNGVSRKSEKSI